MTGPKEPVSFVLPQMLNVPRGEARKVFAWNLLLFQGGRSRFFPRKLVSFDPWHMTRSRAIGTRIWFGRYNNIICLIALYKHQVFKNLL